MSSYKLERFLAELAYKKQDERQSYLNRSIYKNYIQIHAGTSRDEFFSAEDVQGKKHFNVHRGSKTQDDWINTNTELARNNIPETARFKRSSRMSFHASSRYASGRFSDGKKKQVVEVGHSLGGTLAEQIAMSQNHKSVVFNQGTTPFRDYADVDRSKHIHVRNKEDAVSMFDNNEKTIHVDSVYGNGLFPIADMRTMLMGYNLNQYIAGSIYGAVKGHTMDSFK